jgi:hypothetical protein
MQGETARSREMAEVTGRFSYPSSEPADPTAPSLLTLPAEMRNSIYEALFVHHKPIVAVCEWDDLDSQSRSYSLGLPLLSTCRQVHQEASTYFYSRNKFIVTSQGKYCPSQTLVDWTTQWLANIGRQATSVRNVRIDLFLEFMGEDINLSPLLLQYWRTGCSKTKIAFQDTKDFRLIGFDHPYESTDLSLPRVNTLFSALLSDTGGNIKKYNNFPRMVKWLGVNSDGTKVHLEFYLSSDTENDIPPSKVFAMNDNLGLVEVDDGLASEYDIASGIDKIMFRTSTSSNILSQVLPTSGDLVYEIRDNAISPPALAIFGVSGLFRARAHCLLNDHPFIVKFITTGREHLLQEGKRRLKSWPWRTGPSTEPEDQKRRDPGILVLRIETNGATMAGVSFNATNILAITKSYSLAILVRVELADAHATAQEETQYTMSLEDLQFGVMASIGDMIEQGSMDFDAAMPTIWMNGVGQVISADLGPERTVRFDRVHSSQSILRDKAKKIWKTNGAEEEQVGASFVSNTLARLAAHYGWATEAAEVPEGFWF